MGPPSVTAFCDTTAARLPPALSPPTATWSGIAPSVAAFAQSPAEGRDGIVDGGGEPMLGREPIVDREDMHVGVAADAAAQVVVAVEVAEHETAAVIVDQQRPRTARGRRIVARGEGAVAAVDGDVRHRADRDRRAGDGRGVVAEIPPRDVRGQRRDRRAAPEVAQGDQELHLRMQHGPLDHHRRPVREA